MLEVSAKEPEIQDNWHQQYPLSFERKYHRKRYRFDLVNPDRPVGRQRYQITRVDRGILLKIPAKLAAIVRTTLI